MTTDVGNTETIDRLKTWITDCMERNRSPSPDFMRSEVEFIEDNADKVEEPIQATHSNEPDKKANVGRKINPGYVPTLEEIKEG